MTTLEIHSPLFFRDERGDIQDSFFYGGVLISTALETMLKELKIIDEMDEIVSMIVTGDDIEVETLFVDSLPFSILERNYNT